MIKTRERHRGQEHHFQDKTLALSCSMWIFLIKCEIECPTFFNQIEPFLVDMNTIPLAEEMRIATRECRLIDLLDNIGQPGRLIRIGQIRLQCIRVTLGDSLDDAPMERRL